MANRYILIFFFLLMLYGCSDTKSEILEYVNILKNYDFSNSAIKKVQIDPSYKYPYNVYIKVSIDTSKHIELIKDLGLITKKDVDTIELKKTMNIDEFLLYFEMNSINKNRLPHIERIEEDINWWPKKSFIEPIYASSYFDSNGIRKPVLFSKKRNGRMVVSIKGSIVYLLIECWG